MFFEATRSSWNGSTRYSGVRLCCGPSSAPPQGSAFILDMMKRPDKAHKVLAFCAGITRRMASGKGERELM